MTSCLHAERLQAVRAEVLQTGAQSVHDLGCGNGDPFVQLATWPGIALLIETIEHIDPSQLGGASQMAVFSRHRENRARSEA